MPTISELITQINDIKDMDEQTQAKFTEIKAQLQNLRSKISSFKKSTDKEEKINLSKAIQAITIELRVLLIPLLKENSKGENPSVAEKLCYNALIMLTAVRPLNKFDEETKQFLDPISFTPIENDKKVRLSSGYIFNIHSLIQYFQQHQNKLISPINFEEFPRLDQNEIKAIAEKNGIVLLLSSNINPHLVTNFVPEHINNYNESSGISLEGYALGSVSSTTSAPSIATQGDDSSSSSAQNDLVEMLPASTNVGSVMFPTWNSTSTSFRGEGVIRTGRGISSSNLQQTNSYITSGSINSTDSVANTPNTSRTAVPQQLMQNFTPFSLVGGSGSLVNTTPSTFTTSSSTQQATPHLEMNYNQLLSQIFRHHTVFGRRASNTTSANSPQSSTLSNFLNTSRSLYTREFAMQGHDSQSSTPIQGSGGELTQGRRPFQEERFFYPTVQQMIDNAINNLQDVFNASSNLGSNITPPQDLWQQHQTQESSHDTFETHDSSSTDPSVSLDDCAPSQQNLSESRNNQDLAIVPYNTNNQIIPYSNNPFQFFQQSSSSSAANNNSPAQENNTNEEDLDEYKPPIADPD